MDPRLDPTCGAARSLEEKHREQTILLASSEGQLATIVRNTQDRQILAHIGGCARCSSFRTAFCPECAFDLRTEKHGWRCSRGNPSWRDWLPWNWRPRFARRGAPSAQGAAAQGTAAPPRPVADAPATARAAAAAKPPPRPAIPHRRAVSPPAAKPAASPLAHAYAVLGVTSAATAEQVRKAFRERALQYHPDKVAHMAPEFRVVAEQKMKEINDAYEKLKRAL